MKAAALIFFLLANLLWLALVVAVIVGVLKLFSVL